jgi:hypothetical protein
VNVLWLGMLACTTPEPPPPAPVVVETPKPARPKAARSGKPKPKPCLPPPDVAGDAGMAASVGLSEAQVKAALAGVYPAVAQCLATAGATPSGTLHLEVTVACGGVVSRHRVLDAADWTPEALGCAQEALERTAFPAHALPDGEVFEVPLQLR